MYFVANEFNEIQTFRRINVPFQLFSILLFLKVTAAFGSLMNLRPLLGDQSRIHRPRSKQHRPVSNGCELLDPIQSHLSHSDRLSHVLGRRYECTPCLSHRKNSRFHPSHNSILGVHSHLSAVVRRQNRQFHRSVLRGEHQRVHPGSEHARVLHSRPLAARTNRCEHEGSSDESLPRRIWHEQHARITG